MHVGSSAARGRRRSSAISSRSAIVVALRLLAVHQVGQSQERDSQPAVETLLVAAPQLVEGRQLVVASPELQAFLAPIRQRADHEPPEFLRPPARPLEQGGALQSGQPPKGRSETTPSLLVHRHVDVVVDRAAIDPVEPDGMPAHDQARQSRIADRGVEPGEPLLGGHTTESSDARLPRASNNAMRG